jgi:hypothetical protein
VDDSIPEWPEPNPVIIRNGERTLPLHVMHARTLEEIQPFTAGKCQFIYEEPAYEFDSYEITDWIGRVSSDAEAAVSLVKEWSRHVEKYQYFVQVEDDDGAARFKALRNHTLLVSIICDARLGIDTAQMTRVLNLGLQYGMVFTEYRKDAKRGERYDTYAKRFADIFKDLGVMTVNVWHLVDRIRTQIELKASICAKLPPIRHVAGPTIDGRKIRLFYSYSHKDESLRNKLENHLAVLKRNGLIENWHDRKIGAGNEWKGAIDANLEMADVIVLLISSDFLNSDYCYDIEMKRAMERHQQGSAKVIPIVLRACDWSAAPFGSLQAIPTDAKAVTSWSNRDEAFTDIAKGLSKEIQKMIAHA